MSVTDGSITADLAELTVRIDGASSTATPVSGAVSITQGGNTANVAVPGPNLGAGLVVSTGTLVSSTTLTAQSATGAGTVADFGSAKQNITLAVTASAGVSAGVVALEVSQDNTNWYRSTSSLTQSAPGVTQANQQGAWRYGRANVTTAITGGTVSATLMAS